MKPAYLSGFLFVVFLGASSVGMAAGSDPDTDPLHSSNLGNSGMDAGLTGSVGGRYESNVHFYSADDIALYDNGLLRGSKFTEVNSIDDWIQDYTIGGYIKKEFVKQLPTRIEFRTTWNIYSENDNKDNELYSVEVKQNLSRSGNILKLRYSHLPNYFIRYLFDQDSLTYRKSELKKNIYTVSYWMRLTRTIRL